MNNLSTLNIFVSKKIIQANVLNLLSNMQGIRHPLDALKQEVDFSLHYENLLEIEKTLKSDSLNLHIVRLRNLPQRKLIQVIESLKKEFYELSSFSQTA